MQFGGAEEEGEEMILYRIVDLGTGLEVGTGRMERGMERGNYSHGALVGQARALENRNHCAWEVLVKAHARHSHIV